MHAELARVLEALGAAQEAQPSLLGRSMLAAAGAEYAGGLLSPERAALLHAARGADPYPNLRGEVSTLYAVDRGRLW